MTRISTALARLLILIALLQLAACASTPQASVERDAEAKEFRTHPGTAALYVYRAGPAPLDEDSVLYVDGRLIGATLPGAYFRIDVRPGEHVLHGVAHDAGRFEINARGGELYFVALKVIGGQSHFALDDPRAAQRALLACCVLLENWAPGQRPLLR